mmetsp:Transcript_22399/g.64308  ORF Transcript_22399/g.64308 Transcript_22399/m.64308 type:complete len:235 (+) Transcript_22399:306-1010(+)
MRPLLSRLTLLHPRIPLAPPRLIPHRRHTPPTPLARHRLRRSTPRMSPGMASRRSFRAKTGMPVGPTRPTPRRLTPLTVPAKLRLTHRRHTPPIPRVRRKPRLPPSPTPHARARRPTPTPLLLLGAPRMSLRRRRWLLLHRSPTLRYLARLWLPLAPWPRLLFRPMLRPPPPLRHRTLLRRLPWPPCRRTFRPTRLLRPCPVWRCPGRLPAWAPPWPCRHPRRASQADRSRRRS